MKLYAHVGQCNPNQFKQKHFFNKEIWRGVEMGVRAQARDFREPSGALLQTVFSVQLLYCLSQKKKKASGYSIL